MLGLSLAACGSSYVSPPPPLPSSAPLKTEVTIRAGGLDPMLLHIFEGRAVTFINADDKPHALFSDRHPAHETCGGVLNVTLQPGEQRQIGSLPIDACFYHDESNPAATAFQGILVIH
ncbi:MAG TPA: hypothetical protein VFO85_03240 [Vicinamibacteria bacterium]|nr:hypothetical protein [Vicinamibacteria bacterium]